jgi:hypothetical protein
MMTNPMAASEAKPLGLGPEGEGQFERLRACLEFGEGFELFLCGFEAPNALEEVRRRLADAGPEGVEFESLSFERLEDLSTLPERLAGLSPASTGRKIVFAAATGFEEDLKGVWAKGLRRLNERRNATMRDCPHAVVLAGPSWLPWLAHDVAPDLWSVRTALFAFPTPPAPPGVSAGPTIDSWRSGLPMAHELEAPEYYEELASALEGSRRPGEQATRGRLLLRASAAWRLHGDYENALTAARNAGAAFKSADEEIMIAASQGYAADILQQRGETGEALRIYLEEQLPVAEKMGDMDGIAHVRFACARIRLDRGGLAKGEAQTILDELAESFALSKKLQRADAIAIVGSLLGQVLAGGGHADEALSVLDESAAAFDKLGRTQEADQARALQETIRKGKG